MATGIGQEILVVLSGGLDTSGHEESDPRYVAAERIARMWLCVPGSMFWAPNRGAGLSIMMNADLSLAELGRLEHRCRQESKLVMGVSKALVKASIANNVLTVTGHHWLDLRGEFILNVTAAGAAEVLLV